MTIVTGPVLSDVSAFGPFRELAFIITPAFVPQNSDAEPAPHDDLVGSQTSDSDYFCRPSPALFASGIKNGCGRRQRTSPIEGEGTLSCHSPDAVFECSRKCGAAYRRDPDV